MQKEKRKKELKLLINIEQKQRDTWFLNWIPRNKKKGLRKKEAKEMRGRRRVDVEKGEKREVGLNKERKSKW